MEYSAIGPMAVAGYLKDRVPLIEDYFLLSSGESDVFRIKRENGQEDRYKEENIGVTFPFLSVAGLEVVEGDGSQALSEPDKLLIPETTARKWFGSGPVVGREVEQGEKTYVVGAVYQDMPANSVFKNCCYTGLKEKTDWKDWGMQTYVKATTANKKLLQQQVGNVRVGVLDHLYQVLQKKEQMEKEGKAAVRVVPLTDLFYDHTALYDKSEKGNRRSAVIILGVGVLILLIAGINFVNFSMSLAPTRMKGINTHKVLGATAGQLRRKLMIEAILYSLTAFMLSVGILWLFSLTPAASLFSVSLDPVNHWRLLGGVAVLAVVLGMMAGFYPAVYVTSFEPAVVLKGSFVMAPQGIRIRNGLMVFQFMVSITLIICTLLIGAQYRFMQNYSVGYRTENIVWLPMDESLKMNREALADEMLAVPGVLDYTFSETVPRLRIGSTATQLGGEAVHFDFFHVYKNYLDFFGIPVVKGEGFSVTKLEEAQLVVNEMALMKQPVVENFLGCPMPKGLEEGHLKGVISDMHYMPLKQAIGPMALVCSADADYRYLYLKLSGTNVAETLHGIKQVYEALSPTGLFEFRFLEDSLQQNYESEKHLSNFTDGFYCDRASFGRSIRAYNFQCAI